MLRNKCQCFYLLLLCCYVTGCSEESATKDPTNDLSDTMLGDTFSDTDGACGNGQVEAGEECDDGPDNSDERSDACRTNCKNASCGDGTVDDEGLSEQCDDGNRIDDDGCNNVCRLPSCGDGTLQTDEQCDDGPQNSDTLPDACRSDCRSARCGDSVTDTNEDCDDANNLNNDACLSCVAARCGDGFIRQNVEFCDDQNTSPLDGCSDICRSELGFDCQGEPSVCATICGDGVSAGIEACDDANTVDGDYCSADCSTSTGRCGDGVVQANETCDDGNALPNDGCAPNCTLSGGCGDNIVQPTETCDDGNQVEGDYCSSNCSAVTGRCGDGAEQTNEQCDDGNTTVGDYCSNSCIATGFCGDGVLQIPAGEACDDGNTASGDGCALDCAAVEQDWICSGAPSVCISIFCEADERVLNNACVSCPPGTINLAGDDTTGPDTTCDPLFCAENQHVQNNTCADCPPGMNNPPGDDASGPDTICSNDPCYLIFGVRCDDFEQAYVKSSNSDGNDNFGDSVALSGDTLAVGAYIEGSSANGINGNQADNSSGSSGAVYVFVRSGTAWTQQAYIKASNTEATDQFGEALALEGDTLAVGARLEDSVATGINGNQADNAATNSGAVYVFSRTGTTWAQTAYIKASNSGGNDNFGYSLALSADTLAVGARFENSAATGINGNQFDNSAGGSGAAYIFVRSGSTWSQQAYLKASNTEINDTFGFAIDLDGDILAVGAYNEDSNAIGLNGDHFDNSAANSGAVYIFVRSGSAWTQAAYLKASNTEADDQFGYSLALSGDTLAIGARFEDSFATGINGDQADNASANSGAVYVRKIAP